MRNVLHLAILFYFSTRQFYLRTTENKQQFWQQLFVFFYKWYLYL